ncbi:MAG: ABC transporter permease, partial [Acidimicrobiia bacterium]
MTAGWRPGWTIIARKEFGDHLLSGRFVALIAVLGLAAAGAVFAASSTIRDVAPETQGIPALFLKLFTLADAEQVVPFPLVGFVTFLAPLLGIMFGFDAVIGERTGGTLPRLLSQPVHRDDVITGKFAAGLAVVGVMLTALTSFVAGIGIFRLGISPEPTEVARLLVWVVFGVVYVGFWLALATLTSVVVQRAATSALIAMAVWLAMALFGSLLFGFVADVISPAGTGASPAEQLSHLKAEAIISRISPITLFG